MKLKKYLGILLSGVLAIFIVGCSSTETNIPEDKNTKVEETINLTENDIKTIEDNLNTFTEGTAFDGSTFKIENDNKGLKISVLKPITDIMTEYQTITADDTVEAIKKSLVFDDAYECIQDELNKKFDGMQVFIFNGEEEFNNNDYYTLKTIM